MTRERAEALEALYDGWSPEQVLAHCARVMLGLGAVDEASKAAARWAQALARNAGEVGKKQAADDLAHERASGRFAVPAPPKPKLN